MSDGKTYPPSMYPEDDKRLKGFIWRETEQPKKKEDIFRIMVKNVKKIKENTSDQKKIELKS